jgi:TatA/E family protein of Tat protein translocase
MTTGTHEEFDGGCDVFGIGMSEMLIICGVALLVFGPKELPEIAKKIARGVREVRKASDDLRKSIDLDDDEPPRRPKPPPLRSEPERADRELAPAITGSVLTQNADGFDAVDSIDSPADDDHDEFGRLRVRPPVIAATAGQRDERNTDEHVPVLKSAQPVGAHNLDDDEVARG